MNERIQKLVGHATTTIDVKCEGYMGRSYVRQEEFFDKEKFAELIVKECADACYKHKDVESFGIYPIRVAMVTKACSDNIKEHFGVEETKGWVCPKCGTDRTKAVCPKGHHAAVTGDCPMVGVAQ